MIKKIRIILIVVLVILLFCTCNKVCASVYNPVVLGSVIELKADTVGYKDAACKNKKGTAKKGSLAKIVIENENSLGVYVQHKGNLVGCYIKKTANYKVKRGIYKNITDLKIHNGRYQGYYIDLEGNKFILHKQKYYTHVPYWTGSVATDGCGPSSVAIIASGYNKKINPETIVSNCGEWYGSRSAIANFFRNYAKNDKEVVYINGYETKITRQMVRNYLNAGYEAILNVQDGYVGDQYYEGHYYTILDIEPNTNNVFVADPGPQENGWYSLNELTGVKNIIFVNLNR